MIRLVTAKRLDEMTAERERLRADLAAALEGQKQAAEREFAVQQERGRERVTARHEVESVRWSLDIARADAAALRTEVAQLEEKLRTAEAGPERVVVLTRRGEIHSVHLTVEAAYAEAARHGAPATGWRTTPGGKPLADSPWRATPVTVRAERPRGEAV
ncbi:hypothetical protein ACH4LN_07545 [Streptomyces albus]|uniref:hypothetical protein n=1 Tax=Streptomyces albus TaxID=1888 RepID=UPI0037B2B3C8